ncbi:hypothetical protein [Bacillus sp. 123MFChir2]|uniref:hypothetical protein n=1 Tax=Bacillus sp. 123MFChir2 TaxID=1169144 RepID=UPI00035F2377|nr:hypothetical protein [Bacillus sp. 123MFChir2]
MREIEIFIADIFFLIGLTCTIISARLMKYEDSAVRMNNMRNRWLKTKAFRLEEDSWQGYREEEE